MIDIIATILILYLLYKLVFDFIVPVSKTTSQFKSQVNEMRQRQEEQMRNKQQQSHTESKKTTPKNSGTTTTTTDGEYIDFEEVKE
jgi:Sec-independent protein translocase protein TatA